MNKFVEGIMMVNVLDFSDQWIYWLRGDGDQPRRRPPPDEDDEENVGDGDEGGGGNVSGALSTVFTNFQTGAVGVGAAATQLWRAFWPDGKAPTAPAADDSKDRKDQTDPGIKTDVLNLKIGELPNLPVEVDEGSTIAASGPTSATGSTLAAGNFMANGETSGVNGGLDIRGTLGDPTTATSGKLFGRSHRVIHSRADVPFCNGHSWFDDPSTAAGIASFEAMQKRPETPASKLGLLYNLVPGPLATILITQYKKEYDSQQQSVGYHLDITVLDPASKVLSGEKRIYAPSGQDITVNANLNYPLYVKVDDKNENPISFRYGNPLLSFVLRAQWDSNDQSQDHRCVINPQGPWEDKRQIKCSFKY
ncbi:hypothetical protein MMC22_001287 [Lobaria immixta]|nr:hypothetical protein [Lobaria immixta]